MELAKLSTVAVLFLISDVLCCFGQTETGFTRMTECYGKVAEQTRFMVFLHTGTFKEYDFADLSPHFAEHVAVDVRRLLASLGAQVDVEPAVHFSRQVQGAVIQEVVDHIINAKYDLRILITPQKQRVLRKAPL